MNDSTELRASSPTRRSAPPTLARSGPTSFAHALGQRGLLAPTSLGTYAPSTAAAGAGLWLGMVSIYEAHLRRVAMEQAFAALRGEGTPEN